MRGPAVYPMVVSMGARRGARYPNRFGVAHSLGDLDQHQVFDPSAAPAREDCCDGAGPTTYLPSISTKVRSAAALMTGLP